MRWRSDVVVGHRRPCGILSRPAEAEGVSNGERAGVLPAAVSDCASSPQGRKLWLRRLRSRRMSIRMV